VRASYSNGPHSPSHANTCKSETKRELTYGTKKLEYKTGLPDSESAIRFPIGSLVYAIPGWHFTHSDRNGPVGLVNGSVRTVTSRHHTGHHGGPAIITSHNRGYLVLPTQWKFSTTTTTSVGLLKFKPLQTRSDYRPISVTPTLARLMEKAVHKDHSRGV